MTGQKFTPLPMQIVGTGHVVPAKRCTSEAFDAQFGFEPGFLATASGVNSRYVCTTESQIDMALAASKQALLQAKLVPQDIDLFIGACAVPYQPIPATSPLVMGALGVSDGVAAAFDVNATCLSFLNALDVAAAKIALGQCKRALIFSSEIASRALPWTTQPDVAALFGDGAAAVIVEAPRQTGPKICASLMETYPSEFEACQIGSGGTRFDFQNEPALFSEHSQFQMDGRRLFRLAHKHFPAFIQKLLDQAGWLINDVDVIVPHQASPAGLAHLVKSTGLSTDQVINISSAYGNQIAASIPTALDIGARDGRIESGSKVLMLGTSAGVSFGGIALEY